MKMLRWVILFMLVCSVAHSAELLVKAQEPWNNDIDTSKMTKEELQSFNARSRKGDIIVVKPDGWKWGREECPPRFVVVKLKGVKVEDVKHYEEPIYDEKDVENTTLLKVRKYAIDTSTVNDCMAQIGGIKEMQKAEFDTKLITKSQ